MDEKNEMSMDAAIHTIYRRIDRSVDDILVQPGESEAFARAVLGQIGHPDDSSSISTVLRRLITLRKRGEAKGGLPRSPK
jgi:hypothetical protein